MTIMSGTRRGCWKIVPQTLNTFEHDICAHTITDHGSGCAPCLYSLKNTSLSRATTLDESYLLMFDYFLSFSELDDVNLRRNRR